MISINKYPFANQVGVDAVPQGYAGDRDARLQAFLNDLCFKRFGIRASLAHCDPDDKDDGVHVFLSGEHRPYGWDQVDDFTGRLRNNLPRLYSETTPVLPVRLLTQPAIALWKSDQE